MVVTLRPETSPDDVLAETDDVLRLLGRQGPTPANWSVRGRRSVSRSPAAMTVCSNGRARPARSPCCTTGPRWPTTCPGWWPRPAPTTWPPPRGAC
ncbi:hypothetical protein ACFQV4_34820 [Streptomyces thermocarboxydus]